MPTALHRLLDDVGERRIVDVLEVGLVDDREDVVGDRVEEPLDVGARGHRPGGVVHGRQEGQLRLLGHSGEQSVHVDPTLLERDADRRGGGLQRVEHVARKRRPRRDDLVAGIERRLADEADHGVGACGDDDLLEGDTVTRRKRLTKPVAPSVRVPVRLGQRASDRLERLRKRPERPLVRRELDDPVEPELALDRLGGLSRLVRNEPLERRPDKRRRHPGTDRGHAAAGSGDGAGGS